VNILEGMAQIHLDHGQPESAANLLGEALSISLDIGAARPVAQVRHRLGYLHLAQERFDDAEEEFNAVRAAATRLGDLVGMTYAHLGLGLVHLARDEWASADNALQDARSIAERSGDRLSLGRVLLAQADVLLRAGDLAASAGSLGEARLVFTAANAVLWLERTDDLEARLRTAERSAGRTIRRIVDRE
jgi:tetratricopeptide (TPR) repeat protein